MFQSIKKCELDFLKCGITGWCLEVLWTGLGNLRHHDRKLTSNTSLLMFPIYGLAFLIRPIYAVIKNKNFMFRGSLYATFIFLAEYVSGSFLKKHDMCPWDYSKSKYNINGLIRLDYAPAWFSVGLLYEKMLKQK
ncbi:MAG: hypothetical protein IJA27_04700 [Lachnospiraceae bacterium]|nr:hypothetical protein [Lachnospiraceae bacterium]